MTCAATDRVVIEIGTDAVTTNTSYYSNVYYGGSNGTDLADGTDGTLYPSWVNLITQDAPTVTVVAPTRARRTPPRPSSSPARTSWERRASP